MTTPIVQGKRDRYEIILDKNKVAVNSISVVEDCGGYRVLIIGGFRVPSGKSTQPGIFTRRAYHKACFIDKKDAENFKKHISKKLGRGSGPHLLRDLVFARDKNNKEIAAKHTVTVDYGGVNKTFDLNLTNWFGDEPEVPFGVVRIDCEPDDIPQKYNGFPAILKFN